MVFMGNRTASDDAVSSLLQSALGLPAPPNTAVHKNDQMFSYVASTRGSEALARAEYFAAGAQLFKTVEQLARWKFGSFDNVSSLLDFASGYGRLTRFLVQAMPPDRIWVSDIQADAVDFQQQEFGVHGFVSTVSPADLVCDQTFDFIFVASLFSHLPAATFIPWLKKLYALLKPGGLLAFSAHDERHLPPQETMPAEGIWFAEISEIASQDRKDYGVSVVTESFVRAAILDASGRPHYHRIPLGLFYHQDLYLVAKDPSFDFSMLDFIHAPHGAVDYALWSGPHDLKLRGWLVEPAGASPPAEVQILVDGQLIQSCSPSIDRPDLEYYFNNDRLAYAGWECTLHLTDAERARLIVVNAASEGGVQSLLYSGTIAPLVPQGRIESCFVTGEGLIYLKGWAAGAGAAGAHAEVQISVNGQVRQRCLPFLHRPDLQQHFQDDRFLYAGWECYIHPIDRNPEAEISITVHSADGEVTTLYQGTIASLVLLTSPNSPTSAAPSVGETERRLQDELNQRLDYIRHLEAEVARKNEALAALDAKARRWPWQRRV
jgi:SAM-dependent methyltransferase